MPRDRLEDLVRLAMQCDLIGSDSRRILLHGLPSGFVYSLPTVSRPMDQLRFDLMELQRTPRLIGLDRPPLVVWLDNAATHCVTRGDADSARVFARAADDIAPTGVVARIEKDIAAQQSATTGSQTPSSDPTSTAEPAEPAAPAEPMLIFALHPDVRDAWKTVKPPMTPAGHLVAQVPTGPWQHEHLPHAGPWRAAHEALALAIDKELPAMLSDQTPIAIFAHGPISLATWACGRLTQRLHGRPWVIFESVQHDNRTAWRPWGPEWSRPVGQFDEPVLVAQCDPPSTSPTTEIALIFELDRRHDTRALNHALHTAGISNAPRCVVRQLGRSRTPITTAAQIERAIEDIREALERLSDDYPVLTRLHVFYHGPRAFLMRAAAHLPVSALLYEYQSPAHYAPAIYLGGLHHGELVLPGREAPASEDTLDVFIAYSTSSNRHFAGALYDALGGQQRRVFLDFRSLVAGDQWDDVIPSALARSRVTCVLISPATDGSWYLKEEVIQAIRRARSDKDTHRIIPVLLDNIKLDELPYGLSRLHGIRVGRGDTALDVARQIAAVLDDQPNPPAADLLSDPTRDRADPLAPDPARPLRVLFLADDPRKTDRAALTTEVRSIENAIRSNQAWGAIIIEPRFAVRYQELVTALEEVQPDLVHFAGMGESKGIRLLDDNSGKYVSISARGLADVFGLVEGRIRGVILNSSHSADLAAALVAQVDFAIGMPAGISEPAGLDFAGALYAAIAKGKSIAAAVREGKAMMQMRTEDEISPVLHLRTGLTGDRLVLRPR